MILNLHNRVSFEELNCKDVENAAAKLEANSLEALGIRVAASVVHMKERTEIELLLDCFA